MTARGRIALGAIAAATFMASQAAAAVAEPATTPTQAAATERDGQHDFDFEAGHWRIHLKRLVHPLTGSKTWFEFDGTSVTRLLWNGRAQIEEFETTATTDHIEGLTLRTYNSESHQWRLHWANSNDGLLVVPQIGEFKADVGEFYAQDIFNGKTILIRFLWSKTKAGRGRAASLCLGLRRVLALEELDRGLVEVLSVGMAWRAQGVPFFVFHRTAAVWLVLGSTMIHTVRGSALRSGGQNMMS